MWKKWSFYKGYTEQLLNSLMPKMVITKTVKRHDLYWMADVVQRDRVIICLIINQMTTVPLVGLHFINIFTVSQYEDPCIPSGDAWRGWISELLISCGWQQAGRNKHQAKKKTSWNQWWECTSWGRQIRKMSTGYSSMNDKFKGGMTQSMLFVYSEVIILNFPLLYFTCYPYIYCNSATC